MSRFYHLSLPVTDGDPPYWTIGTRFPQGARAEDLRQPDRRALLEDGLPAAELAGPYPAYGLGRFASMYRNPTLEAVRDAQLPPSTVLFLFDRLPADTPVPEGRDVARSVLRRIAALHAHGEPGSAGLHRTKGGVVLREGSDRTYSFVLLPDGARLEFKRRTMNEFVTVVYGDRPAPGAIWSESLDAPVKGTWSLAPRHGLSWWNVPRYRQWIGPGLVATAVYLVVLSALALSMRRRRLHDAARARFLNEIAHDLRTPLTAVRLHAELLASPKRRADREEKYLGVLEREAVRASDLLANLLDLSRLDRGQRVYEMGMLSVAAVVEPCVDEFRRLYPDRAADVACEGESSLVVSADASALARCITNLLDNAGKYTGKGAPIRVTWSAAEAGTVVIRVEDSGPGVPVGERSRLFLRYVRGFRTDGIAGTGLGLSLVKDLVEGMGGTVQYRDDAPGACFELRLGGNNSA